METVRFWRQRWREGTSQVQLCKGQINKYFALENFNSDRIYLLLFSRAVTGKEIWTEQFLLQRQIKHMLVFPKLYY